jgi:hypothetical protein
MRISVLWLTLLSGCSSNDATMEEAHAFTDDAGRVCRATLEKTSATAPVLSEAVECDSGARSCSGESSPCFQLSVEATSFQIRNCPACCRGTASSFTNADCSPITCQADADCVYDRAECSEGVCSCPNNDCD